MYQMHIGQKRIVPATSTGWLAHLARAGMPWPGSSGRASGFAVIAALAALGNPGIPHLAAPASSPGPNWTQQHPATSPPAQYLSSMAYDAATGNIVLFGAYGQTWTWTGSTWSRQHPATSPPNHTGASMAYDAATGNMVLFGGNGGGQARRTTWTWDGTTWTEQHPATSPPARYFASMAYDAATGNMVLFGGANKDGHAINDTWTWDGTTWTRQSPATSPTRGVGAHTAMAYDVATGNVVLFDFNGHTWTWDGTTWTRQSPATSPPARYGESMAYDAATGNVILFGGQTPSTQEDFADTWAWNGTTWTQQHPAVSPSARFSASMDYDAATGNVVLFGGVTAGLSRRFNDTWTWGPVAVSKATIAPAVT